jgi:transcriptional regulator with XRE-family HTH domain
MLRQFREKAKLTPYETAVAMGVCPGTITRWELGHTFPTINQFSKLCELYGLSDEQTLSLVKGSKSQTA